jgi:catechol 2,3-dioxygenase-like lactoylglutathione lyase family enzyme
MAKIKHIAIRTADPEKTAAFYQEIFGLKKAGLGRNGVYLTDGHINLAILKGGNKLGIEHLGFQVEDVDGTLAELERLGGKPLGERINVTPTDAANPQSYYEIKCLGPDDQIIDVSGSGWVGTD